MGELAPASLLLVLHSRATGSPGGNPYEVVAGVHSCCFPVPSLPGELGCTSEEFSTSPQRWSSRLDFHVASCSEQPCSGVIVSIGLPSAGSAPHQHSPCQESYECIKWFY